MNDYSAKSREGQRAKIAHYTRKSDGQVDASGYEVPGMIDAEEKTGPGTMPNTVEARKTPQPRAFKRGGAVHGDGVKHHAGRKARAAGGPMPMPVPAQQAPPQQASNMAQPGQIAPPMPPTNRFNFSPTSPGMMAIGAGLATGGRAARKDGGGNWIAGAVKHRGALHKELGVPAGEKIPAKKLKAAEHSSNPTERKRADLAATLKGMHKARGGSVSDGTLEGTRPTGGRAARKEGGRAKGKTNVNIVIETQPKQQPVPPGPPPGMPPHPMPIAPPSGGPAPPGMPAPPSGMPPGGMPPPYPKPAMGAPGPMMRAAGGKVVEGDMPKGMKSGVGAGGGEGRLIKARDYGKKC